jgi:hypothetical protein
MVPAPRALLPTAVQVLRDSQGAGLAMYGTLTGKAASAAAVLLAIFANSEAFDPTPTLLLVLADDSDRHAQALFTATVHGARVIGIAVAALGDNGGDVTVFYDDGDAFTASFPRMQQALAQSGGVGTVVLSPLRLSDGKEIGLPVGWRVIGEGADTVDLQGPRGESISLAKTLPVYTSETGPSGAVPQVTCCDPRQAFETLYPQIAAAEQRTGFPPQTLGDIVESQPAPAEAHGKAAFILGNLRISGSDYAYLALAEATPGFTDPWTFTLSATMAPQPIFATELPTMLQIWKSYRGAASVFGDDMWRALQNMSATQEMLKSAITTRETADYNADAAWSEGIAAVAAAKGGQTAIGDALAQSLAEKLAGDTGRPWRIVPPASYHFSRQ